MDEITKANRAKQLIEDEVLQEAFGAVKELYTKAWIQTDARDVEGREAIFKAVSIVDQVLAHLEKVVANGVLKEADLKRDLNLKRKPKF